MVIIKIINISGIRTYLGKCILGEDSELFLIDNFTTPRMSDLLLSYFKEYEDHLETLNYEQLFHFLTLIKALLLRAAPYKSKNILNKIKINQRYDTWKIEVEYTYT